MPSRQLITALKESPRHQSFSRLSYNLSSQTACALQLNADLIELAKSFHDLAPLHPAEADLRAYIYDRLEQNIEEAKALLLALAETRRRFYEVL